MRKLIGVSRRKLPTAASRQPPPQPSGDDRRHRADDDAEALGPGNGTYRTPNGAADLLAGRDDDGPAPNPPGAAFADDEYDYDEAVLVPPPPLRFSGASDAFDDIEEEGEESSREGGDGSIYKHLDSFEEKMERELLDLEQFGVSQHTAESSSSSSSSSPSRRSTVETTSRAKKRSQDPDGRGERKPPSTILSYATSAFANASFKKGKGKSGKHLGMLSGKTTKIMSDYQAYLAEIQNEFPLSDDDDDDDDDDVAGNPALVTINQVRENIRDTYRDQQLAMAEEGGNNDPDGRVDACYDDEGKENGPLVEAEKDDNYATGGGKPLYRAWSPPPGSGNAAAGYDLAAVFGDQLRRPMIRGAGQRYQAPPWLRSKRVKRGIITVVALAAVVVLISGVARHGRERDEGLQEWEGKYIAEIEEREKETEEKLARDEAVLASIGIAEGPHVAEIQKEEGERKVSGGDFAAEDFADQAHKIFHQKYGEEASGDEGGNANTPSAKGETAEEEWLREEEAEKKVWGEGLQYFLGHKILEGEPIPPPSQENGADETWDKYNDAALKYHPVFYNRSKGWKGSSYVEALVFCEEEAGLAVCPYDAVCPDGESGEPLGGFREAPHGDWAWIPIVDGHNEWVQAGTTERCVRYSAMHSGEGPEWGMSGEGGEDVTQNVMCCMMS